MLALSRATSAAFGRAWSVNTVRFVHPGTNVSEWSSVKSSRAEGLDKLETAAGVSLAGKFDLFKPHGWQLIAPSGWHCSTHMAHAESAVKQSVLFTELQLSQGGPGGALLSLSRLTGLNTQSANQASSPFSMLCAALDARLVITLPDGSQLEPVERTAADAAAAARTELAGVLVDNNIRKDGGDVDDDESDSALSNADRAPIAVSARFALSPAAGVIWAGAEYTFHPRMLLRASVEAAHRAELKENPNSRMPADDEVDAAVEAMLGSGDVDASPVRYHVSAVADAVRGTLVEVSGECSASRFDDLWPAYSSALGTALGVLCPPNVANALPAAARGELGGAPDDGVHDGSASDHIPQSLHAVASAASAAAGVDGMNAPCGDGDAAADEEQTAVAAAFAEAMSAGAAEGGKQ